MNTNYLRKMSGNLNIKHIKKRFRERFKNAKSWYGEEVTFLRKIDVLEISEIALSPKGYLEHKVKNKGTKKVIFFNGICMWCIVKDNTLKTIYPVSKDELKKLYKLTENKK